MIKGKLSSIHTSVCVCAEYKTVLESTVIMKMHEADYRVKVWLQALKDGSVVVTKVKTLPKVHIRDGWPLLKSSNLILPLSNQCCHDVISRVISHMIFTALISSHIFQPSNCYWNKWKCIAESRYIHCEFQRTVTHERGLWVFIKVSPDLWSSRGFYISPVKPHTGSILHTSPGKYGNTQ